MNGKSFQSEVEAPENKKSAEISRFEVSPAKLLKPKNPFLLLLLGIVLSVPVILLYWAHYNKAISPALAPTGFIHPDMPYYVANARQYEYGRATGPMYANPYDVDINRPRIYFQPLILLWGGLLYLSPIDPGILLAFTTIVLTVISFTLLCHLFHTYDSIYRFKLHFFCLVFLAWGGGLLAPMGAIYSLARHLPFDFFHFDPAGGWWFLNLGRNFCYPTEAFYHLITILIYYCVLKNKRHALYALVLLLAISHPFTGIQYTMIVLSWTLTERYLFNQNTFTIRDHAILLFMFAGIIIYYLFFLPSFDSHKSLMQQWSLNWYLKLPTIIGAYGVVALFALSRCWTTNARVAIRNDPFNRFLLLCIAVSFALSNHELVMAPIQPVHFTRGHIWLPLSMLALPAISRFLNKVNGLQRKTIGRISLACLIFIFLSDNIAYFYHYTLNPPGLYLKRSYKSAINFLDRRIEAHPDYVFISNDPYLSYISASYLPVSPLLGHVFNTPYRQLRATQVNAILSEGKVPEALAGRRMLLVINPNNALFLLKEKTTKIYQNQDVSIYLYPNPQLEDPGEKSKFVS